MQAPQPDLIFDVGFHRAEDTSYYLSRGYRVVAIEAAPDLFRLGRERFRAEIASGQLTLLNYVVSDGTEAQLPFYLSEHTVWNSAHKGVSDRLGYFQKEVMVAATGLGPLIETHGTPFYCKVDIEGMDLQAINSLHPDALPPYFSCESECYGYDEVFTEEQSLATLLALYEKGYRSFKLVEQEGLEEITDRRKRYGKPSLPQRLLRKLSLVPSAVEEIQQKRTVYNQRHGYEFPPGASGTGPLVPSFREGNWLDFSTAQDLLRYYRRQKLAFDGQNLWFDLHARLFRN